MEKIRKLVLWFLLLAILGWRETRSRSIDQLIQSAMTTRSAGHFKQDAPSVLVELDMRFLAEDWQHIQEAIDADEIIARVPAGERKRKKRKATRDLNRRWTNKVIPYAIDDEIFDSQEMLVFNAAIADWEKYTCLDFRRRTSEDLNYISIQNGAGCWSYLGMQGGSQALSLAGGCRFTGVIVHELGHAIGFQHEQNRPDRNLHVQIISQNIEPGEERQFRQYPTSLTNYYGVPYDYTSVMHYGQYEFSKNGKPTIQTLDPEKQNQIGNRYRLSFRDIKLANLMYSCGGSCGQKTCPGEGFVGKDCKCYCPGSPVQECGGGGGGGGGGECEDEHVNCGTRAAQGECLSNPGYMLQSCKVACNVCDGEEGGGGGGSGGEDCEDTGEFLYCGPSANLGWCTTSTMKEYMKLNCAKTCQYCGGGD